MLQTKADSKRTLDISPIPEHVAIIMDGNGRWAKRRGLPRLEGHRAGTENIRRVIETFAQHGVKYLTLYAFSTENWSRPAVEVSGLFGILDRVLQQEVRSLHKRNVRLRHLGRLDRLPRYLQEGLRQSMELTKNNTGITVSVALDYGGREEVLNAVRRIVQKGVAPEEISETLFEQYLHTAGMPAPDLVIRTAGEKRLSNFLIWQSAYSEYYYTPTLWPDFGGEEVERALLSYSQRKRRFGGLGSEDCAS